MRRRAAPTAAATMKRNWLELPREVTAEILRRVGSFDILTGAQYVCTAWRQISRDPSIWRHVEFLSPRKLGRWKNSYLSLCRLAVDLSQGGLISIAIGCFANDDLLFYIAERSSQLKHLAFAACNVSNEALSLLAGKVPLLEELEFSHWSPSEETIQIFGRFCPLLKTLKLNCRGRVSGKFESDDEALAIAKTMHGLVHLQIIGNDLTNAGLEAILDACRHLQSLDLRQCLNLNLRGQLGKTCAQRIKNLRLPDDPIYDPDYSRIPPPVPPPLNLGRDESSDWSSDSDD